MSSTDDPQAAAPDEETVAVAEEPTAPAVEGGKSSGDGDGSVPTRGWLALGAGRWARGAANAQIVTRLRNLIPARPSDPGPTPTPDPPAPADEETKEVLLVEEGYEEAAPDDVTPDDVTPDDATAAPAGPEDAHEIAITMEKDGLDAVGPGRYCPPRHPTRVKLAWIEILR